MKHLIVLLFTLITLISSSLTQGSPPVNPKAAVNKPNIVLFLVDDMAAADLNQMAYLNQIASAGVKFTRFVTPTPWCAPSRASILRGQNSYNTLQLSSWGFDNFYRMDFEKETVAVWLQRAGYKTGLFGKYLNGYMNSGFVPNTYVPPGWNEWYAGIGLGYNYTLNENGVVVKYQEPVSPHMNDELARLAVGFIDRHHNEPMFLYLASTSPHSPPIPAHRQEGWFKYQQLTQGPAFNEDDVSDKPAWVRKKAKIPANEPVRLELFRNRLRTLSSIGDLINRVTAAFVKYGVKDNTYFVWL